MNTRTRAVVRFGLVLLPLCAFLGLIYWAKATWPAFLEARLTDIAEAASGPVAAAPAPAAPPAPTAPPAPSTPPAPPTQPEARPPVPSGSLDLSGVWKFCTDRTEVGQEQGWYRVDHDSNAWRTLNVPGAWEEQGITFENPTWPPTEGEDGYNGYAWYRRSVEVPASWTHAPVTLHLGAIDDSDWTYVNGTLIGSTPENDAYDRERSYLVPASVLRPGQMNVIAILVLDRGGPGGLIKGPVELISGTSTGAAAARAYPRNTGGITKTGAVHIASDEKVSGDVTITDGTVTVDGYVTGNVSVQRGSVVVRSTGRVDGDVTAAGGQVVLEKGAAVRGQVTELPWPGRPGPEQVQMPPQSRVGRALEELPSLVVLLVFGALAALLFPRRLQVMARALPAEPARAGIAGFVGLLLTPAAILALTLAAALVTLVLAIIIIVGWVAIPFVWLGVAAALFGMVVIGALGCLGVCLSLGQAVLARAGRPDASPVWGTLLGVALVWVALALCAGLAAGFGLANTVGGLLWVTIIIFGVGLALMTGAGTSDHWRLRDLHRRRRREREQQEPAPAEEAPVPTAEEPPPASDAAAEDTERGQPDTPTA